MVQYQGSPATSPELEREIVSIKNALAKSIRHKPNGLTLEEAAKLPDSVLIRIKGIGPKRLGLIRRLGRMNTEPVSAPPPKTPSQRLRYYSVVTTLAEVESEILKVSVVEDTNPDYLYNLRQAAAVLRDLKKFL